MKVLILSCNTGEGHNAAARAVCEALRLRGHQAEVLDLMSLGRHHTSAVVGGAYVKLVSYLPGVFGAVYRLGELVRRWKGKSPVYYANARLGKALRAYIVEHGFDALVTTHLYPAETITYLKKNGRLSIPSVAVATDYVCIPFWEETNCDYYVIPHEDLIEEFSRYGVPSEKLLPYGIPVHPDFSQRMTRQQAREYLKLPQDRRIFLIMSGSMGFGKIHLFAQELAWKCQDAEQLVIICGNNTRRERSLRFQFAGNPNVRVVGFTRHVPEYMAACDVIFTKPGGLSSTEAAVEQIPIVHTAPIPGCETANRKFFVSHGMSVAADRRNRQIGQGMYLLNRDSTRERMRRAQQTHTRPDAGDRLVDLLEELLQQEKSDRSCYEN